MAFNPTPLTHTAPYPKKTLGDIRDYVAYLSGPSYDNLSPLEKVLLDNAVNDAAEEHRRTFPEARNYAEQEVVYVWPDDTTKTVELPLDYAQLRGRHIWQVDPTETDKVRHPVELVEETDFLDSWADGRNFYDSTDLPVCRIYRESTDRRRILHVFPTPQTGDTFKVLYWSLLERLVNPTDVLEAPQELQEVVQFGAAKRFLVLRGDPTKAGELAALEAGKVNMLRTAARREESKPRRARTFEEAGGYWGFRPGHPLATQRVRTTRLAEDS